MRAFINWRKKKVNIWGKNLLKKTPYVGKGNVTDINKRNFIKKGIFGLAAGVGIAAFSKMASARYIFPDATSQTTAAITAINSLNGVSYGAATTTGTLLSTSKNITSVSKVATGEYDWTWATDYTNGNYSLTIGSDDSNGYTNRSSARAAGSARIHTHTGNGSHWDIAHMVQAMGNW